jgi:hypothetical protein
MWTAALVAYFKAPSNHFHGENEINQENTCSQKARVESGNIGI